jgi:N4-gp56 family major capsid protein
MNYSDISPRTTAYADRRLLTRAVTNNILGQFGQDRPVPKNKGQVIVFRRYSKLAAATAALVEGVTPTGKTLTKVDIQAQLAQYGDWVGLSDVIMDTHEDPILKETTDILAEQAAETWDLLRAGVLKAGYNVLYANGTARASVNTPISKTLLRKAERTLMRQEAKPITSIVKAGPNVSTFPVPPCFVAVCHTDCKTDIEQLPDFIGVHEYAGSGGKINGEIGASGLIRFVLDNNLTPWTDGGTTKGSMISTTGTNADVYPILIFAKDAYGVVNLSGDEAVGTYWSNPKATSSDPLAQRGTGGWKGWTATAILQDLWMLRLEVACTD